MENQDRLKHFPISWFALVMGLSGFTIAWSRGEAILELPFSIHTLLLGATSVAFLILTLIYAAKLARFRGEVVKELNHPVRLNFFPSFSIALILLSIAFLHASPPLSKWLWSVGATLHFGFTLYVMSVWINHTKFEIHHMNPAWFIPVVGNILVPIAGVHHASPEISWFFFSIGLLFWLVLLTIIYYRVIFHDPLPERLVPTMFILIAPPAVGFISYLALNGGLDNFARVLYYVALFLTTLLLSQFRRFSRLQFFLSWWAYSFPMAAVTIATLLMYAQTRLVAFRWLSFFLLGLLTLIIAVLVVRTIIGIARREICVEEG